MVSKEHCGVGAAVKQPRDFREIREELRDDPEKIYCVDDEYYEYCPLPTVTPLLWLRLTRGDLVRLSLLVKWLFEALGLSGRVLVDQFAFASRTLFLNLAPPASPIPLPYLSGIRPIYNFGMPVPESVSRGLYIIRSFKPRFLIIDAELVPTYLKMLKESGVVLGDLGVSAVVVVTELSSGLMPVDRELFNPHHVDLVNIIQAADALFLAPECSRGWFHVREDHYLVEAVDPNTRSPTDSRGWLAITNLFVRGSALAKYMVPLSVELARIPCRLGEGLHIGVVRNE